MKHVSITGHLALEGSKCGRRYATIEAHQPFSFTSHVTITADHEDADDDMLNEALARFWGRNVTIICDVDEHGDLTATPMRVTVLREGQEQGLDPWEEVVRLRTAIAIISSYQSGGLVADDVSRERHEMIMIARTARRGGDIDQMKGLRQ